MKKALALLLMVGMQGFSVLGNYDILDKHFKDLKITKKCLENSQNAITLDARRIESWCGFLNREFQKYEILARLSAEKEIEPSGFGQLIKMAQMGYILDELASKEDIFNAVDTILSGESDETKKKELDLLLSTQIIYTLTKKIE